MAISSSDITALTDFSWAEIKKSVKAAMVNGVLGGASLSINGRMIGRYNLTELKALYEWADANESIESNGSGLALVQFGERV